MRLSETPRARAEAMERRRRLPDLPGDVAVGYGVLGLPFQSGHVLAFRRLVTTSYSPPSTSVWHRDPQGRWTFWVDVPEEQSCARFYRPALARVEEAEIELRWTGPGTLSLSVPQHRVHWGMRICRSPVTRGLDGAFGILPDAVMESPAALGVLGPLAGKVLGTGPLQVAGVLPTGRSYLIRPRSVWWVKGTAAVVEGREIGRAGSLPDQPAIGSVPVPNRGLFAFGSVVCGAPEPGVTPG